MLINVFTFVSAHVLAFCWCASGKLEVRPSGNTYGVDNDVDAGGILPGPASESVRSSCAGESEDMLSGHGSSWTVFPGRNEEEEDVKRLRQRAQDNVEFRSVCIAAPPHIGGRRRGGDSGGCSEGGLEMSISYRGRTGLVPDIEALVVFSIILFWILMCCPPMPTDHFHPCYNPCYNMACHS